MNRLIGIALLLTATGANAQTVPCTWTDDPIVAGETPIKAEHINEIRRCLEAIQPFSEATIINRMVGTYTFSLTGSTFSGSGVLRFYSFSREDHRTGFWLFDPPTFQSIGLTIPISGHFFLGSYHSIDSFTLYLVIDESFARYFGEDCDFLLHFNAYTPVRWTTYGSSCNYPEQGTIELTRILPHWNEGQGAGNSYPDEESSGRLDQAR